MFLDIQSTGHKLNDPEIASTELLENDEFPFCRGNRKTAIDTFIGSHHCISYCKSLGLPELKQ